MMEGGGSIEIKGKRRRACVLCGRRGNEVNQEKGAHVDFNKHILGYPIP